LDFSHIDVPTPPLRDPEIRRVDGSVQQQHVSAISPVSMDFRQTFVIGASLDEDELIRLFCSKGH